MTPISLPFSLSDVLERVIPGGILLACLGVAVDPTQPIPKAFEESAIASAMFLAGAYAVGVVLQTISTKVRIPGYRQYWREGDPSPQREIKAALQEHFGLPPGEGSWRLCYGSCVKSGYATNTQLFQGLDTFCRSMAVAMAGAALAFGLAGVSLWWVKNLLDLRSILAALSCGFLSRAFWTGASQYSRAFVASIYEGWFNWYKDQAAAAQGQNQPPVQASPAPQLPPG